MQQLQVHKANVDTVLWHGNLRSYVRAMNVKIFSFSRVMQAKEDLKKYFSFKFQVQQLQVHKANVDTVLWHSSLTPYVRAMNVKICSFPHVMQSKEDLKKYFTFYF